MSTIAVVGHDSFELNGSAADNGAGGGDSVRDGFGVAHDPALDAALEIATDRTREAQEDLAVRLAETPAVETEARVVEQRARDLHDLALDAAADDDAGSPDRPT
jgi:hypothetical protein